MKLSGKTVMLLSVGNSGVKTIADVVEPGLLAAGPYLTLKVELDDVPGALARLTAEITQTPSQHLYYHARPAPQVASHRKTEVLVELKTRWSSTSRMSPTI